MEDIGWMDGEGRAGRERGGSPGGKGETSLPLSPAQGAAGSDSQSWDSRTTTTVAVVAAVVHVSYYGLELSIHEAHLT